MCYSELLWVLGIQNRILDTEQMKACEKPLHLLVCLGLVPRNTGKTKLIFKKNSLCCQLCLGTLLLQMNWNPCTFLCRNSLPLGSVLCSSLEVTPPLQMCLQPRLIALGPPTEGQDQGMEQPGCGTRWKYNDKKVWTVPCEGTSSHGFWDNVSWPPPAQDVSKKDERVLSSKKAALIRISTRIINFNAEKPYRILEESWEDFIFSLPWHPVPLEVCHLEFIEL